MTDGHKITELFAWVAVVPGDPDERIPAVNAPGGGVMPLIGPDRTRIECFRDTAEAFARAGAAVELRKFTTAEVLEKLPRGH